MGPVTGTGMVSITLNEHHWVVVLAANEHLVHPALAEISRLRDKG
jgi:hypothetical protein